MAVVVVTGHVAAMMRAKVQATISHWGRQNADFIAIAVLTLSVLLLVLLLPEWQSPLRVVVGLAFILIAPGYALAAILFPGQDDVDSVERLVLSLGLSVITIPLLGLLLNYTPWGIGLVSMVLVLSLFTAVAILFALYRRYRLAPEERFYVAVASTGFKASSRVFLLTCFALGVVVVTAQVLRSAEGFTEFYILGPEGRLESYPTALTSGESFTLSLGVGNFEGRAMSYEIRVPNELEQVVVGVLHLADGETQEVTVELDAPAGSGRTRLSFELYRSGDSSPYRSVHLFVTLVLSPRQQDLAGFMASYYP